jgi:Fe2+ transport system protein B
MKQQFTTTYEGLANEVKDVNKDLKQFKNLIDVDLKIVVKETRELTKEFITLENDMKQKGKHLNAVDANVDKYKGELTKEFRMLKAEMGQHVNKYKTYCKTEKQEKETARKEKKELSKEVENLTKSLEIGQEERKELSKQVKDIPQKIGTAGKRTFKDVIFDIFQIVVLMGLFVKFSPQIGNAVEKVLQRKSGLNDNRLTNNYILKITNFEGIFRQAKSEDVSVRGVFYSSYGYKLQITVYPNGYGKEKNTHLSIFVAILRG